MSNIIIKWLVPEPVYYNVFRDGDLKPEPGMDSLHFGSMQFGASQNAIAGVPQGPIFSPKGMTLSAVTTGGADPVSQTVYVVTERAALEAPAYLRVEVLFDLPCSPVDPGTWALALNLKRGTATDKGPVVDTTIGPNCKFHPMNETPPYEGVWLTGTVPDPDPARNKVDDRPYGQYKTDETVFGLRADLTHTGLNYGGSASLTLLDKKGSSTLPGTLPTQSFGPIITKQTFIDPTMAIGIALVNQPGTPKTVSVRLQSFAIWTRPIEVEIEHILLKHFRRPDPQVIVPLERTKIQRRV
jgi:hypothetical protein